MRDDVCATCPSKAENKASVIALAKVHEDDSDRFAQTIIAELKRLTRAVESNAEKIDRLDHSVHGNGKAGLAQDVLVLKTIANENRRNSGNWAIWIGIAVSALAASIALIAAVAGNAG